MLNTYAITLWVILSLLFAPSLSFRITNHARSAVTKYYNAATLSSRYRSTHSLPFNPVLQVAEPLFSNRGDVNSDGYTQKQLLREETEAPFRNVRIYLYLALLSAAGLGAFIGFTRILAAVARGDSGGEDMTDMYQNLAINLGGIPVLAYLWKREIDSRNSRLERIQRGGSLAALKLKIIVGDEPAVVKLADLRSNRGIEKRVVMVCAKRESLRESLLTSVSQSRSLVQNDLLIVPLVIDQSSTAATAAATAAADYNLIAPSLESIFGSSSGSQQVEGTTETAAVAVEYPAPADLLHIGLPVLVNEWNNVIKAELKSAVQQQPDALDKGITIVIKKNGKVGTRRFGVPIWEALVGDVESRADRGLDVRNI